MMQALLPLVDWAACWWYWLARINYFSMGPTLMMAPPPSAASALLQTNSSSATASLLSSNYSQLPPGLSVDPSSLSFAASLSSLSVTWFSTLPVNLQQGVNPRQGMDLQQGMLTQNPSICTPLSTHPFFLRSFLPPVHPSIPSGSLLDAYISSFYFCTVIYGTVGFGDIHAVTTGEYIFVSILILINAVNL